MHQNILLRLVWFHKTHAPFSIFNAKTKTYVVHFPHQYHRSKALITFMNIEKYLFFLRNGKFHGKPAILQIFGATLHSFINFFTLQVAQVAKFHGIAWACAVRVVNLVYKMQTFLLFFNEQWKFAHWEYNIHLANCSYKKTPFVFPTENFSYDAKFLFESQHWIFYMQILMLATTTIKTSGKKIKDYSYIWFEQFYNELF